MVRNFLKVQMTNLISELALLVVVDTVDGQLSLSDEPASTGNDSISTKMVIPVVLEGQVELEDLTDAGDLLAVQLVEDVVAPLSGSLTDDTRLLEQVCNSFS